MQVATRPASVVVMALALLCAGIALAGPATAVDDVARPDARVTHGPSCRPGGVVVEVTGGTVGYAVTLATTRRPTGEESADLAPGAVVVLSTGPVEWGETIDPFLEYTALDGSGAGYVDELTGFSFTRPAAEDGAAITAPAGAAVVPPAEVVPLPVPGSLDPGSAVPAGSPPVEVSPQEVAAVAGGGVPWPLLAAGGALLASGTGLALVAGGRSWTRDRAPASTGSA